MREVLLPRLGCYRCVYEWTPIRSPVRRCPRCKSLLWDVPKIRPVRLGQGLGVREILEPHRARVLRTARRFGARNVRIFGSVRRSEADARSDVDFLVDWARNARPLARLRLETALSTILGRSVQVAAPPDIPWSFRPQVIAEAVRL
jgi:uncharacterized protein